VSNDLEKPSGFWDQRTGWRRLKETMLLEPLPGGARWAAAFGSLLLFAFVVQVVTGILLTMNYAPSDKTAWASVKFIQEDVPLGAFIRALHHWGSSAMVILLLLHLVQVFVWGAYKRPREFTWMAIPATRGPVEPAAERTKGIGTPEAMIGGGSYSATCTHLAGAAKCSPP
jgi:ubiquinol-cytochrome c reductase cytochrome b subunit